MGLIYNKLMNTTIKLYELCLNQSKDLILIKTVVIENDINQKYYIQLMKKENQITLRLDPITDPLDKNSSVKNL